MMNDRGIIGELAQAIQEAANAVARIVSLGTTGVDEVSRRMSVQQLIDIDARLAVLEATENELIDRRLAQFIAQDRGGDPEVAERAWKELVERMAGTLAPIASLIHDLKGQRNTFVGDEAYPTVLKALSIKAEIFERLERDRHRRNRIMDSGAG